MPDFIPTAQRRWEAEGISFDKWKHVYERPYKITSSTKLQSLQYKIIHRFFPTRKFLCVRMVVDDPFCDECTDIETIEHYFYNCEQVKTFWKEVENALNQKMSNVEKLTIDCKDVLFGNKGFLDIVNFIILVAKQFIVQQHYHEARVSATAF